ncbi:MAG: 1-acyl-sn-glycerol-3-phosphate acyltransferase [Fibrobacter sp.]|nr:1-acyl-sn-glycerol-3-phosphate acyltransferase [Fibrobacter sp.]
MDRQNSGMSAVFNLIKMLFFVFWVVFSTILYGLLVLTFGLLSRKFARFVARLWNQHLLWVGGVKISVDGLNKLGQNKRYVFIANHQSALDIPVLYAGLNQQVSFIAKKELFMIPIFGWGLRVIGHIWIDRGNARKAIESIKRAVMRMKKENVSLILFPEGTRSCDGKVLDFKQGSFSLALQAGVQVVPVAILNSAEMLPKSSFQIRSGTIKLKICDPIDITPEMTKADLCARTHNMVKAAVEGC